jgi:hypothetical protein
VKTHVLSDQSVHITHTYCCVSKLSVFTAVLIMSSMIPLTILSLDTDETVRNLSKEFSVALSSTLIHVLAHFQRTTCSQIYFRFSFYLLRKILRLLNNTCVKHNFKSVHVSNLFWTREYNSAKEICKYPSFSKVGGNYPFGLENWWNCQELK